MLNECVYIVLCLVDHVKNKLSILHKHIQIYYICLYYTRTLQGVSMHSPLAVKGGPLTTPCGSWYILKQYINKLHKHVYRVFDLRTSCQDFSEKGDMASCTRLLLGMAAARAAMSTQPGEHAAQVDELSKAGAMTDRLRPVDTTLQRLFWACKLAGGRPPQKW